MGAGASAGGEAAQRQALPSSPRMHGRRVQCLTTQGPLEEMPLSFTFHEGVNPLEPAFRGNTISGRKEKCGPGGPYHPELLRWDLAHRMAGGYVVRP